MKSVKGGFLVTVLVALIFAAAANASHTTTIAITNGNYDGWGMWDGSTSSTGNTALVGYNSQGWSAVTQVYFTIPAELKVPGVTIVSADLYMETSYANAGNTGYGGTYIQLMKYAYDCNKVTVAQASAIANHLGVPNTANFTKVGAPVYRPIPTGPLVDFQYNWNVKTQLQASIDDGWAYLPLAAMMTRSDGTFYANPYEAYGSGPEPANFFNGYYASFWMYEATGGNPASRINPKITVKYTLPGDAVADFWAVDSDVAFEFPGGDPDNTIYPLLQMEDGVASSNHDAIDYVMDLGQVKSFKAIGIQNRCVYQSNGNPEHARIYVAADESAPGFNPNDVNSFTVQINVELPFADRFSGSVTAANEERFIDVLDGYSRRYVRVQITENASGPISTTNSYVQFQALLLSDTHKGSYTTAGRLFGLPDAIAPEYLDEVSVFTYNDRPGIRFFYNGGPSPDGDMRTDIVLDQISVKDIQKIFFRNWDTEITNENIRLISVWVAPASGAGSESDPDWNSTLKWNKASYSVKIFPQTEGSEGVPQPDVYSKGIVREADVTDVSRRYVLISVRSNFYGDMGTFPPEVGYNWYSSLSDISVLGLSSIGSCNDVTRLGLTLQADLNKDCYVNMLDLKMLADEWLRCTDPGVAGCVQTPGSIPTYSIAPVPVGGITVNGSLSEWPADSEWIYLTKLYYGDYPYDVKEAKMSLRWDDATDKIYAAVIVDDPEHHFSNTATYTADLIEIYSQGDAAGGTGWGAGSTNKYFDAAQQYFVGRNTTTGSWAAWADLTSINSDAGFESAVTLNGDKIIYELGVKQFNNYGGKGGGTTEVTNLAVGSTVGFDIVADTVFGSGLSSMISENMFIGKSDDAGQFQQYTLVNSLPAMSCGGWGYETSDLTQDCRVNLADFATAAIQWFNCNDPTNGNCPHNW